MGIKIYDAILPRNQATVTILTFLIGAVDNCTVLMGSYKHWKGLSNTKILIVILSLCHFAFGLECTTALSQRMKFWETPVYGVKTLGPIYPLDS